jgi:hypothetical protein
VDSVNAGEVTPIVVQQLHEKSSGAGEEALPAVVAAIGNAFFGATGVRLRQFPLTPPRVLAALKSGLTGGRRRVFRASDELDETVRKCLTACKSTVPPGTTVRSPSGQLYLKSELDHYTPDQLLVLPQCR